MSRFLRVTVALGLAVTGAGIVSGFSVAAPGPGATAIVVDPDQALRPISRDLFGYAHRYNVNGMYGYDPESGQVDPVLAQAVEDSGTTVLRYPGAHPADGFDWKEAIGPPEQRGCQPAPPWAGWVDDGAYGVDEHARFAEQVGATTSLVVNVATGTAQDAADWVEYMNAPVGANPNGGTAWAQVRADNGHPAPYGVKWWEIGSEVGNANTWLGALPRAERSQAYAFGGSSSYAGQRLGSGCDFSASAAASTGEPGQEFAVKHPPVTPGSQAVYVGGTLWQPIDDLADAGPDDHVYEIDPANGTVAFGDGTNGLIPSAGAVVTADYTSGPHPGYVDFHRAMKAVDPSVEACWDRHSGILRHEVLGELPLDCATYHPYTWAPPSTDMTATQTHDWVMGRADENAATTVNLQRSLRSFDPDADLGLTEYGIFLGGQDAGPTPGYLRSMDQGLYMASLLTAWIDAGVPLAHKYPLLNWNPDDPPPGAPTVQPSMNQSDFGFYPTFVPQAGAYVTELFTRTLGTQQVAAAVANNPTRAGSAATYEALRTVASIDEQGLLTVIVVNRDPQNPVTASMLPERFRYRSDAEVWTVTGESFTSYNTPADPEAVRLAKDVVEVQEGGFEYTFPAHSVTAIRLTPAGAPASDPVTIDAGEQVTVEAGGQATTTVSVSNTAGDGTRSASGELSALVPAGWTATVDPNVYALAPGQSLEVSVTLTAPDDAADRAAVIVAADQAGEIADTATIPVDVTVPWRELFTDTFDADPTGAPPPDWTVSGPSDGIAVQPDDAGNVLAVQRSAPGTTPITAVRPVSPTDDDVRLSYRVRADQTNQGLAVQLLDGDGTPVLRFNLGANGRFRYSDGDVVPSTDVAYAAGTWYDVALVYHADTGRYEAFVDGTRIAEAARWPGSGPPAAVGILIGPGNTGVAHYAIDDVTVEVPAR